MAICSKAAAARALKLGALASALGTLMYLAVRIAAFAHIFYQHSGVLLTQEAIFEAHSTPDIQIPTVPRITHQIFHNWTNPEDETIPDDWLTTRKTCLDLNEGWDHRLWTSRQSEDFIAKEYPHLLSTYKEFSFPIQKIDTLRYLLMRHYGGIYIDLDNGCQSSLEPLRYYPAWTTDGGRGALSNNILGGEPNHPYWILMTDSIVSHAWNYPFPYMTIMYATGQWYLTKIWEDYHKRLPHGASVLTRVLMDGRPGAPRWVFFTHTRGGTWDNWDNYMFKWIGDHLILICFVALLGFVCCIISLDVFVLRRRRRRPHGYKLVSLEPNLEE